MSSNLILGAIFSERGAANQDMETAQNIHIFFMLLFIAVVLAGLALSNENIIAFSVFFLLYIPALIFVVMVDALIVTGRKWLKNIRQGKSKPNELLLCPHCERTYRKDELDQAPSDEPKCPVCREQLIHSSSHQHS